MFVITWGKKAAFEPIGYAADFCPICRSPQVFQVIRSGVVGHFMDFRVGKFEQTGTVRKCQKCTVTLNCEVQRYMKIAKESASVQDLIAQTYPNVYSDYAERMEREKSLLNGGSGLDQETRRAVIYEPFILVYPEIHNRFSKTSVEPRLFATLFVGFFATMFIAGGVIQALSLIKVQPDSSAPFVMLIMFSIYAYFWVKQSAASRKRFFDKNILPLLNITFSSFKPTEKEVSEVIGLCSRGGRPFWAKANPLWLNGITQK